MTQSYIVDTSVWISFFKGNESDKVQKLVHLLENEWPVYLCPTIIQEILQGITSDKQFREIREYLLAFQILDDDPLTTAIDAASLYRALRKKGITIRKSNDCLIAQYAIKHKLRILHQDRDFDLILENIQN